VEALPPDETFATVVAAGDSRTAVPLGDETFATT